MTSRLSQSCCAFAGHRLLSAGPLVEVAMAVWNALRDGEQEAILVFDDATGRVVDLDLRGTKTEIIERLSRPPQTFAGRHRPRPSDSAPSTEERAPESKGRGRPKLGVISREVTLLPKHWEWLADQPGGASAVLRRLVDEARRNGGSQQRRRAAKEATYQFMLGIAGDFPGYEEATRALFADDHTTLERCIAAWPEDIRAHVLRLATPAQGGAPINALSPNP